jgi:hypothetical protein
MSGENHVELTGRYDAARMLYLTTSCVATKSIEQGGFDFRFSVRETPAISAARVRCKERR